MSASGLINYLSIHITCIVLYVSIHVMQCDHITNAMNMLVMCNEEIYYLNACC